MSYFLYVADGENFGFHINLFYVILSISTIYTVSFNFDSISFLTCVNKVLITWEKLLIS